MIIYKYRKFRVYETGLDEFHLNIMAERGWRVIGIIGNELILERPTLVEKTIQQLIDEGAY